MSNSRLCGRSRDWLWTAVILLLVWETSADGLWFQRCEYLQWLCMLEYKQWSLLSPFPCIFTCWKM